MTRRKAERENAKRLAHRERLLRAQKRKEAASIFSPTAASPAPKPDATSTESPGTPLFVKADAWLSRSTKL
jgi:hypothetical protein